MAIMCTGDRQDEKLANIALTTAMWAMYNLVIDYNTTTMLIEAALTACFSMMHKTAAINYLEYDQQTGKVSFQDNFEDDNISTNA